MNNQPAIDFFLVWDAAFQNIAVRALHQPLAEQLWQKYFPILSYEYKKLISPRYALKDVLYLEKLDDTNLFSVSLIPPCQGITEPRLHFYSQTARYLDEYIPALENMGLRVMDQVQFSMKAAKHDLFIKSFTVKASTDQVLPFFRIKHQLLALIIKVMKGQLENDVLNKLLLLSGLNWRAIDVLRAYRNYYLQLYHQTTSASIHRALINNPEIARCLFVYFEARFRPDPQWDDPVVREEQVLFPLRLQLLANLEKVVNLNDDRILRTLFNLIDATMRCNFHCQKQWPDYFVAFKINSLGVIDMPAPKPQYEIYVHAVTMEGIHLRAGKISRGGIRWSDRPDDFRLEILGLMQTQVSKNALIIPTGAKGGFIVKPNGEKDAKTAGKKAYSTFMRGLLDLTDNYQNNQMVQALNRVCYDDPDPYLVVAADKGTAQFSDLANSVAAEYHFWLKDAFASGGSHGYDHKALGITARGAWECVKRHFRELGKDIQQQAFTVVGIGSMDGDVFGNGMLLSPHIRLLAAFSGQHIFIDPNPVDNQATLQERQRLFELPGSTWNDYDSTLISQGGGVYLRSAKDIPISPELKKWLAIRYNVLSGEALIRHLLTAPVDLLWLGGIGTYVKASTEKQEEVGDRSNDSVRIDASDLKALVVGEGANLGFTQAARIEYHLKGGRINTDAVDNSAGVDTSDHEVNLKILLSQLHQQQLIDDPQCLFAELTDVVCHQVLANNYVQSLCLSLEERRNATNPLLYLQLADKLEASGFLDKTVESFPADKEILNRLGQRLSRPELAVLMAASKRYLTQQLTAATDFLRQDISQAYLAQYFPEPIRTRYHAHLSAHPLAKEIKATVISNKVINQAGCGFLAGFEASGDVSLTDYLKGYLVWDEILVVNELRQDICALDTYMASAKQYELLLQIEDRLSDLCGWLSQQGQEISAKPAVIATYQQYLAEYQGYLKQQSVAYGQQRERYIQEGAPDKIAEGVALFGYVSIFPMVVTLVLETAKDSIVVLETYHDISRYLQIQDMDERLTQTPKQNNWERQLATEMSWDIKHMVAKLTKVILLSTEATCEAYFATSATKHKISRYWRVYQDVQTHTPVSLLHYLVLYKALTALL